MITQPAKVISTFDDHCLVETIPKSACPRCAEGKGCGGGILAQAFANKTYQLTVPYSSNLDEPAISTPVSGSQVLVGMSSNGLLLASLVMYLLPLALMITITALTALFISAEDIYTVTAAAIGLGIGAVFASMLSKLLIDSGITQAHLIPADDNNCWYSAP